MEWWPTLEGFIQKALDHGTGRTTIDDVKTAVAKQLVNLALAWEPETQHIYAVIGMEIKESPQKRILNLSFCGGGELDQWKHCWPVFVDLAARMNLDQVEVTGRPGWSKFTKGTPFKEVARLFILEVPKEA